MPSRPIHQYPAEKLSAALEAIRSGLAIRKASKIYGVPRTTLQDRLHLRVPEGPRKMGPDTVLTAEEESEIAQWCVNMAKCGFPLKPEDLLNTVQNIMQEEQRPNPFINNRPGKKWLKSFFKRHSILSLRAPEDLSKGRSVVTEESIRKWFSLLKEHLKSLGALDILEDPERIFNGDETSFTFCPKSGKVIAPRGYKNLYRITKGKEKEAVTVLLFFSASGETLPPCVVFPYVRPPKDVVESMPDDWFLGKSDSGWMKADIFFDYMSDGLAKWVEARGIKKPVLAFVDGHKSHLTLKLSQHCCDRGIILYALPPNTTHLMQPADVSVFKPLKSEWKITLHDWAVQPENNNKVLTKSSFCPLLANVLKKKNLKETVKNGFRKCGLYPFNPDAVDYGKCVQNTRERLDTSKNKSFSTPQQLKKKECSAASKVIKHLKKELTEVGINVTVVLDTIKNAKVKYCNPNDSSLGEINLNSVAMPDNDSTNNSVSILPSDSVWEMDNNISLPIIGDETLISNLFNSEAVIHTEPLRNDEESMEFQASEGGKDSSFQFVSVLQPLQIQCETVSEVYNLEVVENSSTNLIPNSVQDVNNAPNKGTTYQVTKKSVSNECTKNWPKNNTALKKHLKLPEPILKSSTPKNKNRIGAISSLEWRQIEKDREEKKEKKKAEVLERKQQRLKVKNEKEEQVRKRKLERLSKTVSKKHKVQSQSIVIMKKNDEANKNEQDNNAIGLPEMINIEKYINMPPLALMKRSSSKERVLNESEILELLEDK